MKQEKKKAKNKIQKTQKEKRGRRGSFLVKSVNLLEFQSGRKVEELTIIYETERENSQDLKKFIGVF